MTTAAVTEPLDLIRLSLDELHAYDSHCNIVLGNVQETVTVVDTNASPEGNVVRTVTKHSEMMFVRGDSVTIICMGNKRD
ncbi:hypothetical protein PYCC9005_005607 [Savitreella phatthalungensis]